MVLTFCPLNFFLTSSCFSPLISSSLVFVFLVFESVDFFAFWMFSTHNPGVKGSFTREREIVSIKSLGKYKDGYFLQKVGDPADEPGLIPV